MDLKRDALTGARPQGAKGSRQKGDPLRGPLRDPARGVYRGPLRDPARGVYRGSLTGSLTGSRQGGQTVGFTVSLGEGNLRRVNFKGSYGDP